MTRYMIQHKISGDVWVVDLEANRSCGPLHHKDQSAPLGHYALDDYWSEEDTPSIEGYRVLRSDDHA